VLYCTRVRQRAQDGIGSPRQSGFAADRSYKRGPIAEIRQINIGPERATERSFTSGRSEAVDYGQDSLFHRRSSRTSAFGKLSDRTRARLRQRVQERLEHVTDAMGHAAKTAGR
jgi:hypothetical protein